MKIKELKEKSADELTTMLAEQRDLLRTLRFRVHADQERNVRTIRVARMTVARILTLLTTKSPRNHV